MVMKHSMSITVALGIGLLFAGACAKESPSSKPVTHPTDKDLRAKELVTAFYRVLVHEKPPTYKEERELFGPNSGLRVHLIDKSGAPQTQPVLLELFRKNRDLFLPKNMKDKKNIEYIRISSLFTFLGSPARMSETPENSGYVIVLFVDDAEANPARFRTVMFDVTGGKLEADAIYFNGFEGETTHEKFFDQKWWIEHHGSDWCE
jgi:hypothetical protein